MKTRAIALPKISCGLVNGAWLLPLFLTLIFFTAGCNAVRDEFVDPQAEITVQSPPAYGTVTHVNAAVMVGREIRVGDIALSVDLDEGQTVIVVQPEDNIYTPGDRVRVIRDGQGFVRVQLL